MRCLLLFVTLVVLVACLGPPARVVTVPADQTGLVGAWQLVPLRGRSLEHAGPHLRFAGLGTGDNLMLRRDGTFAAMVPGKPDLTGRWLVRGRHLILRGFAADPDFAFPTTADWPIISQERNLFVVDVSVDLTVGFQRLIIR